MHSSSQLTLRTLVLASLLLVSCSTTPDKSNLDIEASNRTSLMDRVSNDKFSEYSEKVRKETSYQRWWDDMGGSVLSELVQELLKNNLQLHQFEAQIRQVNASTRQVAGKRLPSIRLEAILSTSPTGFKSFQDGLNVGPTATWNADVHGELRLSEERMSVYARIAKQSFMEAQANKIKQLAYEWVNILSQKEEIRVQNENIKMLRDLLDVTQARLSTAE